MSAIDGLARTAARRAGTTLPAAFGDKSSGKPANQLSLKETLDRERILAQDSE
jgi:hypothetical protein